MPQKIGIVGSGLIGRSWSMIFASAGFDIALYDVVPDAVDNALQLIKQQLESLENDGLLRGHLTAAQQFSHISKVSTLQQCVDNTIHIQVSSSY